MDFDTYKQQLLDYLERLSDFEKAEIEEHTNLSDQEKVNQGFMIQNAEISKIDTATKSITMRFVDNNTKWRTGDNIKLVSTQDEHFSLVCVVLENFDKEITFAGQSGVLHIGMTFDLILLEASMTSMICSAIEKIESGRSGSSFIEILGEIAKPEEEYGRPIQGFASASLFNKEQTNAIETIFHRPSIYALQGPPGTGKTAVLAEIAEAYSKEGRDVLVLSYSHQAVNNALNKISSRQGVSVFKIGSPFRTQGLSSTVESMLDMRIFGAYRTAARKHRRRFIKPNGDIVGMTLHSAIMNFVLHKRAFSPSIVLVDEASQIPLPIAAAIGAMGASTNVFIGDDRQMPPIFNQNLVSDPLSISVFEHLHSILPNRIKSVLTTTYRMNMKICSVVSRAFYEPYGIQLQSYPGIAKRTVAGESIDQSLEIINIDSGSNNQEENLQEALKVVDKAVWYSNKGLEVAVITPFRKQVKLIREEWDKAGKPSEILIDTVERLQGQDVDVVIISTSVSDINYLKTVGSFLYMPNRLNVMISRAKSKVVIIKSPIVNIGV